MIDNMKIFIKIKNNQIDNLKKFYIYKECILMIKR